MARLCAEAEAAMARDFAATWDQAVTELQADNRLEDEDALWLRNVDESPGTPVQPGQIGGASSHSAPAQGGSAEQQRSAEAAFWKSLCPSIRSVLRAAVQVRHAAVPATCLRSVCPLACIHATESYLLLHAVMPTLCTARDITWACRCSSRRLNRPQTRLSQPSPPMTQPPCPQRRPCMRACCARLWLSLLQRLHLCCSRTMHRCALSCCQCFKALYPQAQRWPLRHQQPWRLWPNVRFHVCLQHHGVCPRFFSWLACISHTWTLAGCFNS